MFALALSAIQFRNTAFSCHRRAGGNVNLAWMILAFVSTVAGNAVLVGSVANLIVTERAREEYRLSFWNHLRFGLLSTLLVCAAGVPLVYVTGLL